MTHSNNVIHNTSNRKPLMIAILLLYLRFQSVNVPIYYVNLNFKLTLSNAEDHVKDKNDHTCMAWEEFSNP